MTQPVDWPLLAAAYSDSIAIFGGKEVKTMQLFLSQLISLDSLVEDGSYTFQYLDIQYPYEVRI